MKSIKILGVLAACVSYGAIAHAQTTAPADTNAGTADNSSSAANNTTSAAPIVVTGSRIITNGADAPTPVTTVTSAALQNLAPSNIPDALNKLPQFSGSSSNTSGGTFNAGSSPLGNYLNLRSLASSRVLVMLDGKRVAPTTNSNAVDANVLPQMLVKRVDVVTGGASAVYGSDAVSGVVNFVLDDHYKGLKTISQAGISQYGDSFSYKLGAAGGFSVGDRVHVIASYQYYKNNGIPHLYDRSWAANAPSSYGNPIAVAPDIHFWPISDGGTVGSPLNPSVLGGGYTFGQVFLPDGTLVPNNPGLLLGGVAGTGGDGAKWGEARNGGTSITGKLKTQRAFGRVTFDVTDNTELYVQGIYARSDTGFNSTPNNHFPQLNSRQSRIYNDNPFLLPQYRTIMQNAGEEYFGLGRIFNDVPLVTNKTKNEYWSAQVGLKGKFNSNWSWDLTYNYAKATQVSDFNEWDMRKFWAAIDAVDVGHYNGGLNNGAYNGQIVCGVTLRNPGLLPGCIPMNVIGDGNISTAAFNWARGDSIYRIVNEMQYVNANVQGTLFDLPAGPVKVNVGAEYRTQNLTQTTNSNPTVWVNPNGTVNVAAKQAYFQGIRGVPFVNDPNNTGPLLFDSIDVGSAKGSQNVKEVYGELSVPVLKDTPGFQSLNLDLAARYTDYKTSGSVVTWKVGGVWEPTDGVRIRVSQSRDIAAPSLYALYAGESDTFGAFLDTHLPNVPAAQSVPLYATYANPNLKPEKADTTTIGIVLQPEAVRGLTLSVDAYRVKINGAINTPDVTVMANECNASGGTAAVCANFVRAQPYNVIQYVNSAGNLVYNSVQKIVITSQNLAYLETQGIDFELDYMFPLDNVLPSIGGTVGLRAFVGYIDKFTTQNAPGAPILEQAGRSYQSFGGGDAAGLPRWKGTLSQAYTNGRFAMDIDERFTGSYTFGQPGQNFVTPIHVPNRVYVDTNFSYDVGAKKNFQLFLNIQNFFNVKPPLVPTLVENLAVPADKFNYDVVGRYFTAGVRAKF